MNEAVAVGPRPGSVPCLSLGDSAGKAFRFASPPIPPCHDADYIDYTLEEKTEGPSLDDAPDAVQDWITGDGKPRIYNPYAQTVGAVGPTVPSGRSPRGVPAT